MSETRKWLKSTETVGFEVADQVARITLNRPDKRNALSGKMLQELHQALLEADDRTDVNAILLEGAGKDFCAGYDLMDSYGGGEDNSTDHDPSLYRSRADTIDDDIWNLARQQDLLLPMIELHKPIITKIHGNCLAGGTDLAFYSDLVIAADDARIGFPAARANGTPPSNFWIYHCGPQWTKRMLFTGDTICGRDAARIGLVLESYPTEELDHEISEMARRVAAVDSEILSAHKRMVNGQLALMGARASQRAGLDLDAEAHLSRGPRRSKFRSDMAEAGLKEALKNRDAPFGDGKVNLRARSGGAN